MVHTKYERQALRGIEGYLPGCQPKAPVIKLNTNENPYPPATEILQVLKEIDPAILQRYPDPLATAFRTVVADLHELETNNVIATNGGDELLRLAITTYLDPGRPLAIATPSYSLYPVLAAVHGSPTVSIQLNPDWSLPTNTASVWNEAGAQLAMLVNPHAPSGHLHDIEDLARLASEFRGVLLIDEAYVDFVDPDLQYDASSLLADHANILLLRTLSKGYSLAGLRLGYGLASAQLLNPMLSKTKDSYNIDAIAQKLGAAALSHRSAAKETWNTVRNERTRVRNALLELGLGVPASEANFLFATIPENHRGEGAETVYHALMANGIYVRWFEDIKIRDGLRITIGTQQENDALIERLTQWMLNIPLHLPLVSTR